MEDEGDDTDDTSSDEEPHENIEEGEEEKPRKSRLKGVSCNFPLFPPHVTPPSSLEDFFDSRIISLLIPPLPREGLEIGFEEKLANYSHQTESMATLVLPPRMILLVIDLWKS